MDIPRPPIMIEYIYNSEYGITGTIKEIREYFQYHNFSEYEINAIIKGSVIKYTKIEK